MKHLPAVALLVLAVSACGGSDGPSLQGDWVFLGNTGAAGIDFKPDDTYVAQVLAVTNTVTDSQGNIVSGTANDQIENGHYSVSGSTITYMPVQTTCPGDSSSPYTSTYSFNGQNLQLALSDGIISFQPNNSKTTAAYAITTGCFDSNGAFTPHPLAAF